MGSAGVNDLMMENVKEFESIKDEAYKNQKLLDIQTTKVIVGICPICGQEVIEINTKKGEMWVCSDSKKECTFRLYENTKRFEDIIKLTTSKVKKLLSKEHIEVTLTSKSGKSYQAYIKLNINNGYANFINDGFVNKTKSS